MQYRFGDTKEESWSQGASLTHSMANPDIFLERLDVADAEQSLWAFTKMMWPILEPGRPLAEGWAVKAIAEHLEAITNGDLTRLLINVPPGSMKSLLSNVLWPAWEWGPRNMPHLRYVSASYAHSLTVRDNRRCRILIQSELYQRHWGDRVTLVGDQNAKEKYENTQRGFRIATSVSGTATGERGDRFIIDDPHNVKEGESEVKREEAVFWFTEVVPTRVNDLETSARVVIMQRVHEGDVAGHILKHEDNLGYEVLMIPMEFEPERKCYTSIGWEDPRTEENELMFPERFSRKGVDMLKVELSSWGGSYAVAGQLQQRPAPRGGGMFQRADIKIIQAYDLPAGGREVRGWDLAGSESKNSPYTASVKIKKIGNTIYILHAQRKRKLPGAMYKMIKSTAAADGRTVIQDMPQDPGQAGKAQKMELVQMLEGYPAFCGVESGSKVDRALPLSAQSEVGNLVMVEGEWNAALLDEMCVFPAGIFKDQVDALSRAYARVLKTGVLTLLHGGETITAD